MIPDFLLKQVIFRFHVNVPEYISSFMCFFNPVLSNFSFEGVVFNWGVKKYSF